MTYLKHRFSLICFFIITSVFIKINAQTLSFSMTASSKEVTSSCVGTTIIFSNTSSISGDNLSWSYNNTTSNGNSFVYSFTSAGSYIITLKNNLTNETLSKTLIIYSNPTASISLSQSNICTGNSVIFTGTANTTSSIKNYIWSFGDGSSVTQNNIVTHNYNQSGAYNTFLYVEDINGCRSSASSTKTVTVLGSLNVGFSANGADYYSCTNDINFQNTTTENGTNGIIYTWDFGDGTNSTEKNPGNHTYANAGKYSVKLIANIPGNSNCAPGFTKDIFIGKPNIQINIGATKLCTNTSTTIAASSNPSSFLSTNQDVIWQSENGIFNSDSTAISFANAGTYSLTATNRSGCQTVTTSSLRVNASPSGTISLSPNYGICTQTEVKYGITTTNTGNNTKLSYYWNLGDGSTNAGATFTHKYDTAGNYNISVTLTNNEGCSNIFSNNIAVSDLCIDNGYGSTYNPSFGFVSIDCDNLNTLKFYNKDTLKTVSSWIIDSITYPSNGDTTIIKLPTKTKDETYSVQVKYKDGSYDVIREITIINEKADFNITNADNKDNLLCAYNNITFDASKFVNINNLNGQYLWTIKDSDGKYVYKSTTGAPNLSNYAFDSTGSFNVSLDITDLRTPACTSTTSKNLIIKGSIVSFNSDTTVYCNVSEKSVKFNNLSKNPTNNIKNFIWGFGDTENRTVSGSETTTIKNYKISQKNIQYTVLLTAVDDGGCSSYLWKWGYLSISNPYVAFSTEDTILCSSKKIIIQNNSDAWTPSTYLWTIGSYSKKYQNRSDLNINVNIDTFPSYFDVNLKVTDAVGCMKDTTINNYIKFLKPKSSFEITNREVLSTCPPYSIVLKNTSTYSDSVGVWKFSDGSTDQGDTSIYYSVLHPGYNTISLINYGYDGCIDTTSETVRVKGPIAQLSSSDSIGCLPLISDFKVSSTDSITSYQWSLGDGTNFNSSTIKDYTHSYTIRGNYWPTVLVIGGPDEGGCTDILELKDSIIANTQYPKIGVVNKEAVCTLDTSTFINIKDSFGFPVIKYTWHWNDGSAEQVTDADSLKHIFLGKNKSYPIVLSAETEYCTVNSDTLNVAYHLKPIINFTSPNSICKNDTLNLISSVRNIENQDNIYNWYLGDSSVYIGKDSIYKSTFLKQNFDSIKLVVLSESGCTDSITKPILLLNLPKISFNVIDKFCIGDSVTINTTSDATSFKWIPTKYIVNDSVQNPVVYPDSTNFFYVNLIGANTCTNNDSLIISVDQKVGLTFKDNYNYCISDSSNLDLTANAINSNVFIWSSTPSTGYMSSDSGTLIQVKPTEKTSYKVVGISPNTCPDEIGNILVNVYQRPKINFSTKVITIGAGEYFSLNPQITNNGTSLYHYQWTPTTGLDNAYSDNSNAISDKDITYTLNITSGFGCASSDSITVKVLCTSSKLYMANAFTPNGDGKNDRFYVTGYGIKSVEHFIIVDRWGKKMFERNNIMSNDFSQGWDGTVNNGKQVEPGTYMYFADIICTEGQKYQLKGSVTLIR